MPGAELVAQPGDVYVDGALTGEGIAPDGAEQLPPAEDLVSYFQQNPNVIVQLLNDEGGCWNTTFLPPAKMNREDLFKERLP